MPGILGFLLSDKEWPIHPTGRMCLILNPQDDSDVMHEGLVLYVEASARMVGVKINGENRVDEWPYEMVWVEIGQIDRPSIRSKK